MLSHAPTLVPTGGEADAGLDQGVGDSNLYPPALCKFFHLHGKSPFVTKRPEKGGVIFPHLAVVDERA